MSIQFNPQSVPPAVNESAGQRAAPRAVPAMAPVHLTPLVPPSSGPANAMPGVTADIATSRRQAFWAGKQQVLLDRLAQTGHSAGALSATQREACIGTLKTVARAVAARLGN